MGCIYTRWQGREDHPRHELEATRSRLFCGGGSDEGPPDTPLFVLNGSGPVDVFARDNVAVDRSGQEVRIIGTNNKKCRRVDAPPLWPDAIKTMERKLIKGTLGMMADF